MNLRFFKICLPILIVSDAASAVSNTAWDCEQTKTGEWACQSQTATTGGAEQSAPAATSSTPVQAKVPAQPQTAQESSAPTVVAAPIQQPIMPPVATVPVTRKQSPVAVSQSVTAAPETAAVVESPRRAVNVTQNQKPRLQKVEPVREQVAATEKQPPGWSCQAGGNQSWNCNLAGPDPKGQAQVVEAAEESSMFLPPAFNASQELAFQTLRSTYKVDPWLNCESWARRKPKLQTTPVDRENATTDVTADFSESFEGEVLSFAGNVDLVRADQHLLADKASYDTKADTMDAQGNVIYNEGSLAFAADTAVMGLSSSQARLRNAAFITGDGPLRGTAETIYRDSESLSRLNEASFTSCPPGNQDWVMHTSRLKINRESGQGSAKDLWLEFKGVPVAYMPYISFPTDNRRLSGFLSPTWGNTQRSGFYVAAPFYWNIAPNVDSTITPRYFSRRGEMLSNNLRYLTESSKGNFGFEYMPNDMLLSKARYSLNVKDVSTIMPKLNSTVDLNLVSDHNYFTDLNTALGFNRSSFLPSMGTLAYGVAPGINASASVQHYQAVDPTVTSATQPYDVLPRLNLNMVHSFSSMPLRVQMDSQYADFRHNVLVNGQRLVLAPGVSMPFESSAGFFTPKVSVQSTQYQLSNQALTGQPASINRTLPIMSLDSGLVFEKNTSFGGDAYSNIIEPRLFYLYIPRKNQSSIPVFDTSAYDINFNSLFRENSYSGYDRLQDANQLTVAATSRYINSATGLEPVKASVGQILYFQDRTVTLPLPGTTQQSTNPADYISAQTSKTSNFVSEVSGQIDENFSYNTGGQWNPSSNSLARAQAVLRFRNQPNEIFDIGYRFRSATANPLLPAALVPGTTANSNPTQANISVADASFRWPLFDQWYAMGRWQYSLNFDKTLESFIGLEKENCCWRFRIIGRRYINGATTSNYVASNVAPQTAFFIELELKGLSGIGDDVDYFLTTALNGYRSTSNSNY